MDSAMAAFRDRARGRNLARVEVIADALHAMGDGELTEEVRLGAFGDAHSLAGSAGTFGFAEASTLGRELEALLGDVDGAENSSTRAERGGRLVARLRAVLADSAAAPASAAGDDLP